MVGFCSRYSAEGVTNLSFAEDNVAVAIGGLEHLRGSDYKEDLSVKVNFPFGTQCVVRVRSLVGVE